MCNSFMFCYNRTEGGDFMPVGVLTNVCAVFIGTFIGGFIKKILPKHLINKDAYILLDYLLYEKVAYLIKMQR